MYEIHNLMYFYHRIYPASGPSRKCNEPIIIIIIYSLKFPIPKSSSTQYLPKPNCFICLEHLPIHVSHAYCPKYVRKVIDPSSPSMRQNFIAALYRAR